MSRFEEFRQKNIIKMRERKESETKAFLGRVNTIINKTDDIVHPSVGRLREAKNNYIDFYICSYPNCFQCEITMYKKDYPFDIYYSKKYFKREVPKKYLKEFEELETYFTIAN